MGSKLSLASSTFFLSRLIASYYKHSRKTNFALCMHRISTLLQAIASVMFTCECTNLIFIILNWLINDIVGIVPACRLNPIETSLFVISICSTTLLFVFRARAVFLGSHRATVFFFACWMIVVCFCFTMPFSFTAVKGPGEGCTIRAMETYCVSCFVAAAMNDIAVFFLITWKILSFFAAGEGYKSCFACFWGKDDLPLIPDILLRTGQQYVLWVVDLVTVMYASLTTFLSLRRVDLLWQWKQWVLHWCMHHNCLTRSGHA